MTMQHGTRSHGVARRCLAIAGAMALALTVAACSPDAAVTASPTGVTHSSTAPPSTSVEAPTGTTAPTTSAAPLAPKPTTQTAEPRPTVTSTPTPKPTTTPTPLPIVLERGDTGPKVRAFQARLRQIGWLRGEVGDHYGSRTVAAVRGFQAKRGFP